MRTLWWEDGAWGESREDIIANDGRNERPAEADNTPSPWDIPRQTTRPIEEPF